LEPSFYLHLPSKALDLDLPFPFCLKTVRNLRWT
jgi:hypothetical protein